jgi:RNA polymerase sigma-70 factor, ECF subfamily
VITLRFGAKRREEAIEREIPALRRFARALTESAEQADDLVHECLVRALSSWPALRREERLRSWLFSILYRTHLMGVRRRSRAPGLVSLDDVEGGADAAARPGLDAVERDEIVRAMRQLSEEHRAALLLVAVDELSYAEAAEVLQIPIGTLMSRLGRARQRLRALLEGEKVVALRRVP